MKMNTSSPHEKLSILEEGWRCEKDNQVSILKRIEKPSGCSRIVEITKLIFYLELIFFIGWMGCVFLSQNIANTNYNDSKTQSSHACGHSTVDCTPSEINNQIDHKRNGIRDKRDTDEDEAKLQSCISYMNATRDAIAELSIQFIPGEDSDSVTIALRENYPTQIVNLVMRVIMNRLISSTVASSDATEEQWRAYALDVQQGIINDTGEEHRQRIESSGPPTPEMVTNLRTTIESMISNFRDCEKIIWFVDESTTGPSLGDILKEREKCETITQTLKDDARPLITRIIPGDSSHPEIVQIRERVENMTMLMTSSLMVNSTPTWNLDIVSERIGNLTDEKWRKFINSMRDDAVNSSSSALREQIETNGPITQELINDIRTVLNTYLNKVRRCDEVTIVINNIRRQIEEVQAKTKRDADPISEHELLNDYLKTELNMVKLFAFRNIDHATGETF